MRYKFLSILISLSLLQFASAETLQVTELRKSKINLYNLQTGNLVKKVPRDQFSLPLKVMRETQNNRLVIVFEGSEYGIKRRAAKTNDRLVSNAQCNNSFKAEKSGVHRGLGEGCAQ
ncbi:hypothetical protein Q4488_09205 [Amphritea sp. 1_MG-2023]|uniref:hypothetical protein n=1 Tax=Amphritea sp. 1_MG-2023 TaxID=3062670 RepID=UPI0026E23956|nr:hypothetical protein [Amphritea sp. 1_MG-2023]MDO6563559.1 hypothetical protein [Amphritea sp. 1_MG-2023]